MDAKLLTKYRECRTPRVGRGHRLWHTPASQALSQARAQLRLADARRRFENVGAVYYAPDPRGRERDLQRMYNDYGNAHPYVRLVYIPEDDFGPYMDFDCCEAAGEKLDLCQHVLDRADRFEHPGEFLASLTERERENICRYGQPCRDKCEAAHRANSDGLNAIVAEYRTAEGTWELAESHGWEVGEGSEIESLMEAALEALATKQAC